MCPTHRSRPYVNILYQGGITRANIIVAKVFPAEHSIALSENEFITISNRNEWGEQFDSILFTMNRKISLSSDSHFDLVAKK